MTYTIDEIKNNWLVEGTIPYSEESVVAAFNEVKMALGQEWLDNMKVNKGVENRGPYITISAVELGLKLLVLKKGVNYISLIKKLLSKLEVEKIKGLAELDAIYFLCNENDIEFELEPQVERLGKTNSHPDFRLKKLTDDKWTFVEVKQPDMSEENKSVRTVIEKIQNLFSSYDNYLSIEIMLLRTPTEEELNIVEKKCLTLFSQKDKRELEIENLGMIKINYSENINYTPSEYIGFVGKPALASMQTIVETKDTGEAVLKKLISCRIAVSDERARRFLIDASSQLPSTSSNLIWVDGKNVPSIKIWTKLIGKQFSEKPALNKKISCLITFTAGIGLRDNMISVLNLIAFVQNENPSYEIPDWIKEKLNSCG
jgi:hypothetical protein